MSDWKVRGGDGTEQPMRIEQIQAAAKHGRVKPETYIYNPITGQWRYAREIEELRSHWPVAPVAPATPTNAGKSMCGVAVALFLSSVALGMMNLGKALSMILVAAAFLCGISAIVFFAMKK